MSEDPRIERLRRLLGQQRFEDETHRGVALEERRRADSAKLADQGSESHVQKPSSGNTKEIISAASTQPPSKKLQDSKGPISGKKTSLAARAGPSQAKVLKGKRRRVREKTSPYSDTETETDTDGETWSFAMEAGPEMAFCPILGVNKYPYKYFSHEKEIMEKIADCRFNNGQFFDRHWTLFYIHPPITISLTPIIFVPAHEVRKLLEEVTRNTDVKCDFPATPGFEVQFEPNEPRPRYLGVSNSRQEFDEMAARASDSTELSGAWSKTRHGDDRSLEAWTRKLEEALNATKQKKQRSKAFAQQKRTASKQQWCRQLRRSQRYLGLRSSNAKEAKGAYTTIQDEISALSLANTIDDIENPPTISPDNPPQFAFDMDVVFVCIDIEAHEVIQSQITEVGLCTLDTRDLKGVAPGEYAKNWRSLIKYRHFRIAEFRHHVNNKYVSGCPDRFEKDFGVSEFIPEFSVAKVVAMCCKSPFPVTAGDRAAVEAKLTSSGGSPFEPRKIVLVGHSFDSDVGYLQRRGLEILKLNGLVEVLDTSMIHRALVRETQATNLANVLNMCQIAGWNLHNAGNDAGYTLQALLAMAVDHLVNPNHRQTEEERVQRREVAAKLALEREDSDFQDWLIADRGSPTLEF